MSYNLIRFKNVSELLKYLDERISNMTSRVEEFSKYLGGLRSKAERMRKLESALGEIMGEEISTMNEMDLMGLKVVVGARAVDELKVVEEVLASMQDIIVSLQKARKILEPFARTMESGEEGQVEGVDILVETLNGIPVRLLLKEAG